MSDRVASLELAIDSRPAAQGADVLDRLTAAATRAEASAQRLAGAQRAQVVGINAVSAAILQQGSPLGAGRQAPHATADKVRSQSPP